MSKSSKRRLAIAAIKNAADAAIPHATAADPAAALNQSLPNSAKSLLQAAAQTAAFPSALNTQNSAHSQSSVLSDPYVLSASPLDSSSPPNSQLSTLNSSSDSALSLPSSSDISNLKSDIASSSASPSTPRTLQEMLTDPPSEFFKTHLEPHCPPEQVDSILLPAILPDPNNPAGPIDSQLQLYQSKLKPVFAKLAPDDPTVERISHNYVVVLQIATVERMIHSLPGLSESAQVETNNQIVRMLFIIERTNSRRARELREKDAAARRIIRDQQRKERQAQKEADTIARNQRNKDREENRRQREQANADRAAQKHELAMRKLDLMEREMVVPEKGTAAEKPSHYHNPNESPDSRTLV